MDAATELMSNVINVKELAGDKVMTPPPPEAELTCDPGEPDVLQDRWITMRQSLKPNSPGTFQEQEVTHTPTNKQATRSAGSAPTHHPGRGDVSVGGPVTLDCFPTG